MAQVVKPGVLKRIKRSFPILLLLFCTALILISRVGKGIDVKDSLRVATDKKTKPTIVLHVGTRHTGSFFVQSVLTSLEAKALLEKDNFVFLGTTPQGISDSVYLKHDGRAIFQHFEKNIVMEQMIMSYPHHPEVKNGTLRLQPHFTNKVEALRKQGKHVLLVYEEMGAFTPREIETLAEFLKPHFHVQVFIAYRPLFPWLASVQNENNKSPKRSNLWPKMPGAYHNRPFDLEDSYAVPSSLLWHSIGHYRKHPAELVREKYERHFDVKILPLHQLRAPTTSKPDPLVEYIFCNALKGLTPTMCKSVKTKALRIRTSENSNPSDPSLAYNILADRAYEKRLIPRNSTRVDVIALVKREHESHRRTVKDFPLKCMSKETLQMLEKMSRDVEKSLYFADWNNAQEVTHHKTFEVSVKKKLHCYIDADRTLEMKQWQKFFKSFGR
jgi:hypothetical protein